MLKLEDSMTFEMAEDFSLGTRIKVIGIGGGGGNAVARMMQTGLHGVEYYVLNTDRQALLASPVPNKLAIGTKVTNGLGAGSDPEIGRKAALEDTERIIEILEGADMVFVTAGLGGGTGTGAAPIVASLAKELNALTVAVVTKPFRFEGPRRMRIAEHGLAELAGTVDTVITIPNTRLLEVLKGKTGYLEAFTLVDDVLRQAVHGISDIITTPGVINRDFADIRAIMSGMGHAMMSTATAKGDGAVIEAAKKAISNPLLEDTGVEGARGLLINITGSSQLPIQEVDEACNLILAAVCNEEVHFNHGMVLDEKMGDEVKVTVIATGFERPGAEAPLRVQVPRATKATTASSSAGAPAPVPVVNQPLPTPVVPEIVPEEAAPPPPAPPIRTEILRMDSYDSAPVQMEIPHEAPMVQQQMPEPQITNGAPANDYETPAFMRRKRSMFN